MYLLYVTAALGEGGAGQLGAMLSTVTPEPSLRATSLATLPSTTWRQRAFSGRTTMTWRTPRAAAACGDGLDRPPRGRHLAPGLDAPLLDGGHGLLGICACSFHLLPGGHQARVGQPERRSVDTGDGDDRHGSPSLSASA